MSRNPPAVTLHQQDGALTMQAFADREGLTLKQALTAARRGQLLGARQNPLSNRWWVYPPAKLLHRPKSRSKPAAAVACSSHTSDKAAAPRLPVHPTEAQEGHGVAGIPEGGRCTPTTEGQAEGIHPPASSQAAQRCAGISPGVYRSPEARSVCQVLREAAARQHREGIHYLRLDGREFSRLYAALERERSRVRKLVGKGLAAVGELRATDSVWQKMQAMCQEGRLL